jgi:hypothetical protein
MQHGGWGMVFLPLYCNDIFQVRKNKAIIAEHLGAIIFDSVQIVKGVRL